MKEVKDNERQGKVAAHTATSLDRERARLALPFLAIPVIFLVAFFVIPLAQTLYISFTDWFGTFRTSGWVGLENYLTLARDELFRGAILHTFVYFGISLVILFPIAIFIAWALLKTTKMRSFYQLAIFAPAVLSVAVAGVLWKFIYNPNFGILNAALEAIGLETMARPWLGDPSTAMLAIVIAVVWHGIATWIILILSGMDRIPQEVTEAAAIDGASSWQTFSRVTLPLLWPILSTLIVLWFIQAMQTFAFIYVMTQGGPYGTTEVMATYMYRMAFQGRMFASGSAMAIIMTLMVLAMSLFGSKLLRSDRFEE